MNQSHPIWARVHALLDEGRDPLEDPAVHAHLAEHPEDFVALDRIVAPLASMAVIPAADLDPRPWSHVAPLLALAGFAAALLLILRPGETVSDHDPPADASARSIIFDYRVDLVVEDGTSRTHRTLTPAGETMRVDRFDARQGVFFFNAIAHAPEATR